MRGWRLVLAVTILGCCCTPVSADTTYKYDTLGRLRCAIYNNGTTVITIVYTYDQAGNRTQVVTQSAACPI